MYKYRYGLTLAVVITTIQLVADMYSHISVLK